MLLHNQHSESIAVVLLKKQEATTYCQKQTMIGCVIACIYSSSLSSQS